MNIGIVCNDTKGGVLPYVALGAGLRAAGHRVTVVAPQDFASVVMKQGLTFAPLSGSQEQIAEVSAGAAERGTLSTMRLMLTELRSACGNGRARRSTGAKARSLCSEAWAAW